MPPAVTESGTELAAEQRRPYKQKQREPAYLFPLSMESEYVFSFLTVLMGVCRTTHSKYEDLNLDVPPQATRVLVQASQPQFSNRPARIEEDFKHLRVRYDGTIFSIHVH